MKLTNKFGFVPQLKSMLETRQITGRTGKVFESLHALSTENNLLTLRALMLEFQPKNTLEIGLSYGGSCLVLAATHRDLMHQPLKQHVAIDPFQSTVWDDTARMALEQEKLVDYVDIYEEFSFSALPKLIERELKFDLIYIDGSHLFEDVFIDFFYSNKLLNDRGLLIFDDSADPNIRKVLNFIEANFKQTYKKIDLSYLRKGSEKVKYHLANTLRKNQLTAYCKQGSSDRPWNSAFHNF
jgi:predicted O-methyltransferase YrrM